MKKILLFLMIFICLSTSIMLCACKKKESEDKSSEDILREDEGSIGYLFNQYEGYYYKQASFIEEENKVIVAYTTNKTKNMEDSVIALRIGVKSENGYTFSKDFSIAIEPSLDGWDKYNIGNADIMAGKFNYDNVEYNYIMVYEANNIKAKKRMQVGVAVSKDLSNWKKVGKSPILEYDYEIYGDNVGICKPSIVNLGTNGNVLLFYTYASARITESRFIEMKASDLNNIQRSGNIAVPHKGLPLDGLEWATIINGDFVYNKETDTIYMIKDGMIFASQNAKEATLVEIASIPRGDMYKQNATWNQISEVSAIEVGSYTRLHSACLISNKYSQINSEILKIVFTSDIAASNSDDTTYIYKSGLHFYQITEE